MKRISERGDLLAIWNPIPNYNGRVQSAGDMRHAGRNPLVMAISKDDGNTWGEYMIIEDETDHGYCYTAIHFMDDSILLGYCAGGPEDKNCLAKLRIKKIMLDGLYEVFGGQKC